MEPKKVSFGFKKTIARPNKIVVEEKKEFIECVEEKAIRVVGGEEVVENLPIVIPAQPNTLRNADRLKLIAESVEKGIEEIGIEKKTEIKTEVPENETLDQMAVRELLENAKKEVKVEKSDLKLLAPENRIPDGAKESTLDDYENIPVGQFGMAMLRGMGWDANQEKSKYKLPELRPKGLGLGADKVVKENQKKSAKKENEELTIIRNGFIKVVTGKYSNYYGVVVSLDEDNGRVMVNIPMKKETVSLSEFMIQPVTKSEYNRESKVINKDSYETYKKNETGQNRETDTSKVTNISRHNSPNEGTSSKNTASRDEKDKYNDDKNRERNRNAEHRSDKDSDRKRNEDDRDKARRREKDRESSPERSRRKDRESSSSPERSKKSKHKKKRDKSNDSESSDSDRKHKSKKDKSKKDIDKKRKGKKKKRDRDRSPNYKKHRK